MSTNAKRAQSSIDQDLDVIHKLKKKIEARNSKFAKQVKLDIENTYWEKKKEIEDFYNKKIKEVTSYVNKKYEMVKSVAVKHEEKMAGYAKECKALMKKYEEVMDEKKKVSKLIGGGKSELKRYVEKTLRKAQSLKKVQKRDLKKRRRGVEEKIENYVNDKRENRKINKIFSSVFQ